MKKLLCLLLVFVFLLPAGCASADPKPTLGLVYVAGNETFTLGVPGRPTKITTHGLFGSDTTACAYEAPMEPIQWEASKHPGTLRLVFSSPAENLVVMQTDGATGLTEKAAMQDNTLTIEGGKSYGFTVSATLTSGSTVYEMEFAFDLIYTPEVGNLEDITLPEPSPTPEPETSEAPQTSREPFTEPAPDPDTEVDDSPVIYPQPPELAVLYNDEKFYPKMGATSWNYHTDIGHISGFEADAEHPLLWKGYTTVERIYNVDEMWLVFKERPDWITVTCWKDTFAGDSIDVSDNWYSKIEAAAVDVEVGSDGRVELSTGYRTGYIYMVKCGWNTDAAREEILGDENYWGGQTVYAFALTETNY